MAKKPVRGTHTGVAGPLGAALPKARPGAGRTAGVGRVSDEGKSFVDRAKVDQAKTKTRAKAKSGSSPKARPVTAAAAASVAAAAKKPLGGLRGLLARNVGHNEELAKKRMLAASRKG